MLRALLLAVLLISINGCTPFIMCEDIDLVCNDVNCLFMHRCYR